MKPSPIISRAGFLARRFGTPLYVMDEDAIVQNLRAYQNALRRFYPGPSEVAYAGKAFLVKALCKLLMAESAGLDVASAGEMHTALAAGFPAQRMHLHGNCKTQEELAMALRFKLGRIVVDNEQELEILNEEAARRRGQARVLLRLAPGIDVATHRYVKTAHAETKFGIPLQSGEAARVALRALRMRHIRLMGFHAHLGSQLFDGKPLILLIETLFAFLQQLKRRSGHVFAELNLGGGLAIRYNDKRRPPGIEHWAQLMANAVLQQSHRLAYPLPRLIIEPGRSIVGPAGITLYRIHYIKRLASGKTYLFVDGGLSDNPRPALYGAQYRVALANRLRAKPLGLYTVAGKHCETDTLFENVRLPSPQRGDILAVFDTGAYNYSMSSNYNRYPRPAVVFVRSSRAPLGVHRPWAATGSAPPAQRASGAPRVPALRAGAPQVPLSPRAAGSPPAAGPARQARLVVRRETLADIVRYDA